MRTLICMLLTLTLLTSAGRASASGFAVNEQSTSAMSMALAVSAKPDDSSTIFYNPGGLGYLDGINIYVGAALLFPLFNYSDPEGVRPSAKNTKRFAQVPNLYISYRINDMHSVGLGFAAPFGIAVVWPDDWTGNLVIKKVDLQTIGIYPTYTFRPHKMVSIGVTPVIMVSTVTLIRGLGLADESGNIVGDIGLGARSVGFGANVGIQVRPMDGLYLGFMYRSRIKINYSGTAEFDVPLVNSSALQDQDVSTSLTFPDRFTLGIGYDILKNLYLSLDVDYYLWSTFKSLEIKFKKPLELPTGEKSKEVIENDWKNSWSFKLGMQYRIKEIVPIRLGIAYELSPGPTSTLSPRLPTGSLLFITLGSGYFHKGTGFFFDIGYLFGKWFGTEVDAQHSNFGFPQKYNNSIHILSFNVGLHH